MNIARLSALLLITLMLIPIDASAHCKGKHKPGHEHCEPGDPTDPGDPITYVATLTGAFAFDTENNSVDVTANKQGNVLKSADPVTLVRPDEPILQAIWNSVFEKCPNFFEPTEVIVPGFTAPAGKKGWTIEKPGGVRVNFRDIPFPQEDFPGGSVNVESAWVALSLIGEIPFQDDFPPGTITLSHFTIHGQTESGVTPRLACDDDNFALVDFTMEPPILLTITAK